jgi:hypothetical protein
VREGVEEVEERPKACFKTRRGHGEQELLLAADDVRGGRGWSSGRGGAAWRARKKARGGKLGRRLAWR